MADDVLILAELLCARLVHDLSGPVGAVANGAELLGDGIDDSGGGEIAREAIALLTDSAAAAVGRLRILRAALGIQAATPIPFAEARRLAADYFKKGVSGPEAIALDWPAAIDAALGSTPARLVLNLLLLARDCLPRGGAIRLLGPAAGTVLTVVAEHSHAVLGEAAKAVAATGIADLTVRGAQGYFAARLAAQEGLSMTIAARPGRVTITVAVGTA